MESLSPYEQQFQALGVDPSTAAQAGAIAQKQANDPSYTLSNEDQNIRNAAFQQILQNQLEAAMQQQQEEQEQRQREEEERINAAVFEYVRLLEQAQETESIGLIDAAAAVKQQLLAEGVSEAEFNQRVSAIDGVLWSESYDYDESDDSAFEARWQKETQSIGVPGNLQHSELLDDRFRELREQQLERNEDEQERRRLRHHVQQADLDL
ncbi:hypothetical protein H6F87_26385 [Cyanobacteria bacterium FACHB-502]|nr:hypothetical protein [Cyanobacteria bacterium FACHB-502]